MNTPFPIPQSGLHLYYNPYSNCAQRVMLLLAEKNLEVELHLVDLLKSQQLTEDYIRINPNGEVPTLIHEGTIITESCDILTYLETAFPEPSFSPSSPNAQESMSDLLEKAANSHYEGVVNYVYSAGYGRLPTPKDWDFYQQHIPHRAEFHRLRRKGKAGSDLDQATAVLDKQFSELEENLKENKWLAGENYTLADIAWFPNTIILRQLGFSFKSYPNIENWIRRIENRPAYQSGIQTNLKKIPNWVLQLVLKGLRLTGGRS